MKTNKRVMVMAWEIARDGVKKFDGKVGEYFAEALKIAWAEVRKATVTTTSGSKRNKSWVARIVGTHARRGFDRQFVDAVEENDWTGKVFELNNGVYEICDAGDREFIRVENGKIEYIEYNDVVAVVA